MDIELKIYNIEWINNDVDKFYKHLANTHDDKYYKNPMVNAILLESNYALHIMPQICAYAIQLVLVLSHH